MSLNYVWKQKISGNKVTTYAAQITACDWQDKWGRNGKEERGGDEGKYSTTPNKKWYPKQTNKH